MFLLESLFSLLIHKATSLGVEYYTQVKLIIKRQCNIFYSNSIGFVWESVRENKCEALN